MVYREFYRRHLPHWQPECAVLFITYRLAGSLPRNIAERLTQRRRRVATSSDAILDPQSRRKRQPSDDRHCFARWDRALDNDTEGPRWLGRPDIARIIAESLHYRDGESFDLLAYCIMPNHVHMVCQVNGPADDRRPVPLHKIMQSLKRHTARQANRVLGRQGAFWQEESYDHVVRDEAQLERVIAYVLGNPVRAGLVEKWDEWPWSYCCEPG